MQCSSIKQTICYLAMYEVVNSSSEISTLTQENRIYTCKTISDDNWEQDSFFYDMMTSSNGTIFRVTCHLCGEFTGPRWIPRTKASDTELWCFLWSESE